MVLKMKLHNIDKRYIVILSSIFLGFILGYSDSKIAYDLSGIVVEVNMNLLKFVSIPIIFFSITSTITKMDNITRVQKLFSTVLKYTISTTLISATIAMLTYLLVIGDSTSPSLAGVDFPINTNGILDTQGYAKHLLSIIPSNIFEVFVSSNVLAIVFTAILISIAVLNLEEENKRIMQNILSASFATFTKVADYVISLLVASLWAFICLLYHDLNSFHNDSLIFVYIAAVIIANLVQAFIILPLFLLYHRVDVIKTAKATIPALVTAFLTKSSYAAMPTTMDCLKNRLNLSEQSVSFTIPLCTTVNMNACAAFIYITVLFVSQSNGVHFSTLDYVIWIFLSTLAAIGNAATPMGCFFMSTAYLVSMDVPIIIMTTLVLPFYTLLDMMETSINVWSDICIASIVDKADIDISSGDANL